MSVCLLLAAVVADLPPADAAAFRETVEVLAVPELRGRAWPESREAANYVARRMGDSGLTPLFGTRFVDPIFDKEGREIGENVGAMLLGSDPKMAGEFVLVTAHHDHIGVIGRQVHPGANDNASGVAMVLEVARILCQQSHPRTVVFVSFGLEERMLWGSRTFVADPPVDLSKIQLFITADMLGRPLGDLPTDAVFAIGSESVGVEGSAVGAFADELDALSVKTGQPVLRIGGDVVGTRSDYGPFRDKEVPFVFFSTGENPDYHQPTDVPDRLHYETAARITDVIAAVAADAADRSDSLVWSEEHPLDVHEAAAFLTVARLVLSEADAGRFDLPVVQRLLVQQVEDRAAAVVKRGVMTESERAVLKRAAQMMMVSIF